MTPHRLPRAVRYCAALIAGAAWLGIAVQFAASFAKLGSVAASIWSMLRFFTILSNLCVAILFSRIAAGHATANRSFLTGGAAVMMLLVGIVYALLLRGLVLQNGLELFADFLLHTVTPILVPLFWLGFAAKGALRWRDPWAWAAIPLLYLCYALVRGSIGGAYPYPFLDVTRLGWARMALNAFGIAVAFVGASFLLVAFDRWLARRAQRPGAYGKSSAR
jgi:hypothetical protein